MLSVKVLEKNVDVAVDSKPAWKSLCEECSYATKKRGFSKATSRQMLKEIRKKNNF